MFVNVIKLKKRVVEQFIRCFFVFEFILDQYKTKILGFRLSKKSKITLETKAFGEAFLLVFLNFLHFYI